MGPINLALVKLFDADQKLREAQTRLQWATKNVRAQEQKTQDLVQRQATLHDRLKLLQAKANEQDLEIKSLDARIDKLREQQQVATDNRLYQAFLVEINTHKADRGKLEEDLLKQLEQIERLQGEHGTVSTQKQTEADKLTTLQSEIGDRVRDLQAEVETLRPTREEAAAAVPGKAREQFEKFADRFDGEAMAAIDKPHVKREEYICSSCNLELTVDVYNRLHTRDETVICPSGKHLLFIPEDLTPEIAVNKPKEKKKAAPRSRATKGTKKKKDIGAPVPMQTLASNVVTSVDEESETMVPPSDGVSTAGASTGAASAGQTSMPAAPVAPAAEGTKSTLPAPSDAAAIPAKEQAVAVDSKSADASIQASAEVAHDVSGSPPARSGTDLQVAGVSGETKTDADGSDDDSDA